MHGRLIAIAALVLAGALLLQSVGFAQRRLGFVDWRQHRAIAYDTRPAKDPVARLQAAIDEGTIVLERRGESGYLRSLLDALAVPVESQIVVFEPDSLQRRRIRFDNPRALYFNDQVSVGWVDGGLIELASQDPEQGVRFYTVDDPWLGLGQPRLTSRRAPECLGCHGVRPTDFIPGMVMHVDHGTPLDQRWTGWFVTGDLGRIEHYGNAAVEDLSGASLPLDRFNWPSLAGHVDMTGYLSPYSDVAALLVFEHQMRMMNLLTRVAWTARIEEDGTGVDRLPSTLDAIVRETVDYMLFVDEPPFPEPVRGTSGFAEAFNRLGPFDGRGRSLRRLDLSTRLMRYPCSYLVYSPQFGRLPSDAHGRLYARLWGVLSGTDDDPRYADLSADDRQAIVEILRETKTDLPTYFQPLPRE